MESMLCESSEERGKKIMKMGAAQTKKRTSEGSGVKREPGTKD